MVPNSCSLSFCVKTWRNSFSRPWIVCTSHKIIRAKIKQRRLDRMLAGNVSADHMSTHHTDISTKRLTCLWLHFRIRRWRGWRWSYRQRGERSSGPFNTLSWALSCHKPSSRLHLGEYNSLILTCFWSLCPRWRILKANISQINTTDGCNGFSFPSVRKIF